MGLTMILFFLLVISFIGVIVGVLIKNSIITIISIISCIILIAFVFFLIFVLVPSM